MLLCRETEGVPSGLPYIIILLKIEEQAAGEGSGNGTAQRREWYKMRLEKLHADNSG